jgi:cytochrome b pre-mRNA-processing protein 3
MLNRLLRKKSIKVAARALYDQLSAASRDPELYGPGRVADTPDGRFELLALHAAVFFNRFAKRGAQAEETSQEVFDILFSAMDHALRELGVGDISVGKRIRKLAESFYGRLAVYHEGIVGGDAKSEVLTKAIATHTLESEDTTHPFAAILATRIVTWADKLEQQGDADLLAGRMGIPL